MNDIQALRNEYSKQGIDERTINKDPLQQFGLWMQQAWDAGIPEANGFVLSTVSQTAYPSQRTVLMKEFDENGFVFFTNHHSRKGQQIAKNKQVSMLFPWYGLHRQVHIQGEISRISLEKSFEYFKTRSRSSQIGARASRQSTVISSRQELESNIASEKEKFIGQEIPPPDFWGGYCVYPIYMEFWQGRPHRLHDRIVFKKNTSSSWDIFRLSP